MRANTGLSDVGLLTADAVRDAQFWTAVLNARVSDRIGAAPLLRIDDVHHKIALFPARYFPDCIGATKSRNFFNTAMS